VTYIPSIIYSNSHIKDKAEFENGKVNDFVRVIVDSKRKILPFPWPEEHRFLTDAKIQIIDKIERQLLCLTSNRFVNKSGLASRLLYGQKGIGKSSSLTLATIAAYICFPNVIRW